MNFNLNEKKLVTEAYLYKALDFKVTAENTAYAFFLFLRVTDKKKDTKKINGRYDSYSSRQNHHLEKASTFITV